MPQARLIIPLFVMNAVIVRDNPSATASNLREFGNLYHLKNGVPLQKHITKTYLNFDGVKTEVIP